MDRIIKERDMMHIVSSQRPVIGITTTLMHEAELNLTTCHMYYNYIQAVARSGGLPLMIPIHTIEGPTPSDYLNQLDGLLLTGGLEYLNPNLYGQEPNRKIFLLMPERDDWELQLVNTFFSEDKPVLGICRGLQLLNVLCGGTIYNDIPEELPQVQGHRQLPTPMRHPYHSICIKPDSILHEVYGKEQLMVNSVHSQAVKDLAPEYTATAHARDGIIECIESLSHRWVVGVQFHPEALADGETEHLKLFKALVNASAGG